jgi:flagellar biosynthetic protein FliO
MEQMQQVVAVLAVLGLLGGSLWWLRRKGLAQFGGAALRRKGARRMETIERLALTPQHSLHLVRVGEKTLLVGVSPAGCALLESLPHTPEADR